MSEEQRARSTKEQAVKMMSMQHVKAPETEFDYRFLGDWVEADLLARNIYGGREEVEGFVKEFFGAK